MDIAILGAGGFIGSHLVETLVNDGRHAVVGLDKTDEKLAGITGPNFEYIPVDASHEVEAFESAIRGADVVVDLIAYANPSIYVKSPLDVYKLNFEANMKVVELCVEHGARLIQYSTSEIYGEPGDSKVYSEDESPLVMGPTIQNRWIYASAKQLLERVIHAYGLLGELDYTIVRPFNFIGPRLDYLVSAGSLGGPRVVAPNRDLVNLGRFDSSLGLEA